MASDDAFDHALMGESGHALDGLVPDPGGMRQAEIARRAGGQEALFDAAVDHPGFQYRSAVSEQGDGIAVLDVLGGLRATEELHHVLLLCLAEIDSVVRQQDRPRCLGSSRSGRTTSGPGGVACGRRGVGQRAVTFPPIEAIGCRNIGRASTQPITTTTMDAAKYQNPVQLTSSVPVYM